MTNEKEIQDLRDSTVALIKHTEEMLHWIIKEMATHYAQSAVERINLSTDLYKLANTAERLGELKYIYNRDLKKSDEQPAE